MNINSLLDSQNDCSSRGWKICVELNHIGYSLVERSHVMENFPMVKASISSGCATKALKLPEVIHFVWTKMTSKKTWVTKATKRSLKTAELHTN